MTGLPCAEENMALRLAVSIQKQSVTDGQTNRQTDRTAVINIAVPGSHVCVTVISGLRVRRLRLQ